MLILAHANGRPELRGPMSTRSSSHSRGGVFRLAPGLGFPDAAYLKVFDDLATPRDAGLS